MRTLSVSREIGDPMDVPTHARKLVATSYSKNLAEAASVIPVPLPDQLSPPEVLIRVRYAGVNAGFDTLACEGKLSFLPGSTSGELAPRPYDLGVEAVGLVARLGQQASKSYNVGDAVACVKVGVGYSEFALVDENDVVRIPVLSPDYVALLPSAYSASFGLSAIGEARAGDKVLITAGAGALGSFAVQLAKHAKCHVVSTCGSEAKAEFLRGLGCDRVIIYKSEDVDTVLKNEYPNGVNVAFDSIGGAMFATCVRHIAVRGRVVVAGAFSEYAGTSNPDAGVSQNLNTHLLFRSASVRGFVMPHFRSELVEHREKVLRLYGDGILRSFVDAGSEKFVGLDSVASAVEHQLKGQNIGKVYVTLP